MLEEIFWFVIYLLHRYYELEVKSQGIVRVGWGNPSLGAGSQLGTDGQSYVFDGFVVSMN